MRYFQQYYNQVLACFLAGVLLFTGIDMIEDFGEGTSLVHMLTECLIMLSALLALGWLWRATSLLTSHTRQLGSRLAAASAASAKWRDEAAQIMQGLAAAIDRQLDAWRLSPSEKEVGLLLLKGLALKEIAQLRGTSERTVRQQAQEAYKKAGLAGRAEFAAYFLEDLLAPRPAAPPRERAGASADPQAGASARPRPATSSPAAGTL